MHHAARPAAWQRCLTFALPARPSFSSCPLFYFYYRKINTSTSKYFPSLLLLLLFLIFKPNGKRENSKKKKLSEPIEFCRALVPKVLHMIEINIDNWNESNINKSLDFFSGWGKKSCFNCRCGLMQNVFLARTLVTKILTANSVIKKIMASVGRFQCSSGQHNEREKKLLFQTCDFSPFFHTQDEKGKKKKRRSWMELRVDPMPCVRLEWQVFSSSKILWREGEKERQETWGICMPFPHKRIRGRGSPVFYFFFFSVYVQLTRRVRQIRESEREDEEERKKERKKRVFSPTRNVIYCVALLPISYLRK